MNRMTKIQVSKYYRERQSVWAQKMLSLMMQHQLAIMGPENSSSSMSSWRSEVNLDENGHRYVGLVNQAMTCYLNSLIQTLYMTPEFRNAIYSWLNTFKPSDEQKNIPLQLKKLFLLLQTSERSSLETRDLTISFGWESGDAYEQHDVQELCRVMFDALEHRWKKTETHHATLIDDLYKGILEDYVKCLTCKMEKVRPDAFYDLPLAIKPFGVNKSFSSIEEALRAFIKPEILDEQNKYSCDRCQSNQTAEKGLRIKSFPYILSIQLKRFDFDYNTLLRFKLNDSMTFPDYLDLNDFVYVPKVEPKMSYADAAAKPPPPPDFTTPPESGQEQQENQNDCSSPYKYKWLNVPRDSEEVQNLLKRGPYVYELFSIMVHQGGASGGHYFAYIKNLEQDKWFCFNDTMVQSASDSEIYRTFGGYYGSWSANTSAYMLMYRQIDPDRNEKFIRSEELPQNVKELMEKMVSEEEERNMSFHRQAEADSSNPSSSLFVDQTFSKEEIIVCSSQPEEPGGRVEPEGTQSDETELVSEMPVDPELPKPRLTSTFRSSRSSVSASSSHSSVRASNARTSIDHVQAYESSGTGSSSKGNVDDDEGVGLDDNMEEMSDLQSFHTSTTTSNSSQTTGTYVREMFNKTLNKIANDEGSSRGLGAKEPMVPSEAGLSDFQGDPVAASMPFKKDDLLVPSQSNSLTPPGSPDSLEAGEEALGLESFQSFENETGDTMNVSGFNTPERSPVTPEDSTQLLNSFDSVPPVVLSAPPVPTVPVPKWSVSGRTERPLRIQKASFSETD